MKPADRVSAGTDRESIWTFEADSAVLEVDVSGVDDAGRRDRLRRIVSGYPSSEADAAVRLVIERDDSGFRAHSELGSTAVDMSEVRREAIPYVEPLTTANPEHLQVAVDEWVEAASLVFGEPRGPRLHAAATVFDGDCWVIAGESNAGKSTLAFDALCRGAEHLTDERLTVAPEGIVGLARPLRLRAEINDVIARAPDWLTPLDDPFRTIVTHDVYSRGRGRRTSPTRADNLLLLTEPPDGPVTLPWVVRRLVELSHDAIEIGPEALVALADFVSRADVRVRAPRSVSSLSDVGAPDRPATPGDSYELVRPRPGSSVIADSATVVAADGAVVWLPGTPPRVMSLTGPGATTWQELLEPAGIVDERAGEFVASLRDLGALVTS